MKDKFYTGIILFDEDLNNSKMMNDNSFRKFKASKNQPLKKPPQTKLINQGNNTKYNEQAISAVNDSFGFGENNQGDIGNLKEDFHSEFGSPKQELNSPQQEHIPRFTNYPENLQEMREDSFKANSKLDERIQFLMKCLDFQEYAHLLIQNKINFNDLLLITKEDFIEMKIPVGPRNRILNFVSDYKVYAKTYSLEEIRYFLTKNDHLYVNNLEKQALIESVGLNLKEKAQSKRSHSYQFADEVFVPPEKNNFDNNLYSPFFASTQGNNYLGNLNTDMLNSIHNENNSKDDSLKFIDLTQEDEKKKRKFHLNKNLYSNAEVFDNSLKFNTLPEKEENEENPHPKRDKTPPERDLRKSKGFQEETSRTRNVVKKINENKSLKKEFDILNEEVEDFIKKFKFQKEKSKERSNKIKCIIKNRGRDKSQDSQPSAQLYTLPTKDLKYNDTHPEGEFEETRNLNEELQRVLNRINSGSQFGNQNNIDSFSMNKVKSSNRGSTQTKSSDLSEANINKLYEIWDKKKQIFNDLNRCNSSIVDKKKIIRLLDEENKRDALGYSYSDYSEKNFHLGNSNYDDEIGEEENMKEYPQRGPDNENFNLSATSRKLKI